MKQKNIRLKKSLTPEKLRSHLSRFFIKTKLVTNFVYILIKLEINKQSIALDKGIIVDTSSRESKISFIKNISDIYISNHFSAKGNDIIHIYYIESDYEKYMKQSSNLINNLNQNVIPFSANLTGNKTTLKK